MVGSRQIDQVLLHHDQHVLRPEYPQAWLNEVPHLSRALSNAQATTRLPAQQQSSMSGSVEAERRRYGHYCA